MPFGYGEPALAIHSTASTNTRLSAASAPCRSFCPATSVQPVPIGIMQ
ncbi:MAG: hypothetical protein ABL933_14210 [Methyloglobulus sp.]|nr:hypothetical protein [Methyloglobulus sp.]